MKFTHLYVRRNKLVAVCLGRECREVCKWWITRIMIKSRRGIFDKNTQYQNTIQFHQNKERVFWYVGTEQARSGHLHFTCLKQAMTALFLCIETTFGKDPAPPSPEGWSMEWSPNRTLPMAMIRSLPLFHFPFVKNHWFARRANQWPLVRETILSSVPPSNSLVSVSDAWRAFWADTAPCKVPRLTPSSSMQH